MSASPWAGVWLAEDIDQIAHAVRSGSWIEGTLAGAGAALDGLALVSDPAGALLQYGVAWLIEHVRLLSEPLDRLAGDPARIVAQAATWRNVALSLDDEASAVRLAAGGDVPDWTGAAATAYRTHADQHVRRLRALSTAAEVIAAATEAAGALIGAVRLMIRDAIATVVSRLITYAIELAATLGAATPLVAEQAATLCAAWAARIAGWLRGLLASLRSLGTMLARLSRDIDGLGRSHRPAEGGLRREGDGIVRIRRKILMTMGNVEAVAAKYGIDISDVPLTIDKVRGGSPGAEFFGVTREDGAVTLFRDAFIDEEQLAKTLAHERFHVDEIRSGLPVPRRPRALKAWEDRAYAYENRWWQEHRHLLDE